ALADPNLLGHALPGASWSSWRVLLIAAMGEALIDAQEREVFARLTGRAQEPGKPVEEAAFIVGRRGGKSRAISTLACYIAALCQHDLVGGETGVALLIAPDTKQAKIALDYCESILTASPVLRQLVVNRTADALELSNRTSIEVRASSFRRLRGPS